MIPILVLLAQTVDWELIFPNQSFMPWGTNPFMLYDNTLIFTGLRWSGDSLKTGICAAADTGTGAILWEKELAQTQWVRTTCVASDGDFIYVAGDGGETKSGFKGLTEDFLLFKLDGAGNVLWWRRPITKNLYEVCHTLLVDPWGNVVVAGVEYDLVANNFNISDWSVDGDGNTRWRFSYDSPYHHNDESFSAALDDDGSVYVGGCCYRPTGRKSLSKNMDGYAWGFSPGMKSPVSLIPPPTDTCYGKHPLLLKLDNNGNLVWIKDYADWNQGGTLCVVDYRYDKIFIAGGHSGEIYTACYDKYGWQFWDNWSAGYFLGLGNGFPAGDGNYYMTGAKHNPGPEVFIRCLDSLGGERYLNLLCPGGGSSIVVDWMGNLFIGGKLMHDRDSFAYDDFGVIKLDTLGNVSWIFQKHGPLHHWDACYKVLPDNRGGVFAMGLLNNTDSTFIQYIVHLVDDQEVAETGGGELMRLSMVSSGFLISGYEGPVQVYDATGRLILSREITGKTLISPLNRGVYFVIAGKQKAKVAVR